MKDSTASESHGVAEHPFSDTGGRAVRAAHGHVSRSDIVAAYRIFLGRVPESEEAIQAHMRASSLEELLRHFISSREYANRAPLSLNRPLNWPPIAVEVDVDAAQLRKMHERVQRTWTGLGNDEPYWSVLTHPDFKLGTFLANETKFDVTGRKEVETFEAIASRCGAKLSTRQTCLELGCGVGRLTAWLASRFSHVIATDISTSHLSLARSTLANRGITNVSFVHLDRPEAITNLARFDVFFSLIVLQHNPPPIIHFILHNSLSRLSPGGIAYFQVPTYNAEYSFDVEKYLLSEGAPQMEMHLIPQERVFSIIAATGCSLLEVREDGLTGMRNGISNTFLLQKK